MALYLVQHGKCISADLDPQRRLSPEGKAEVIRTAEEAKYYGIQVSLIQHSGKTRAEQTAQLIGSVLNPEILIEQRKGINPLDDVIPVAIKMEGADNIMLVGHLPFMERLVAYLITGIAERPVIKFRNGGIVCLDKHPESRTWVIEWALVPVVNY